MLSNAQRHGFSEMNTAPVSTLDLTKANAALTNLTMGGFEVPKEACLSVTAHDLLKQLLSEEKVVSALEGKVRKFGVIMWVLSNV